MNQMTPEELSALDVWIFEHVFGARFEEIPLRPGTATKFHGCFVNAPIPGHKIVKYPQGLCFSSFESAILPERTLARYSPHFTTDPAASDALDDKIIEKLWTNREFYRMGFNDSGAYLMTAIFKGENIISHHPDKKICRAKFAKLLFGGKDE